MTSEQIVENLNQKLKERLNQNKVISASDLNDFSAIELMWLAVYSGNDDALWKLKEINMTRELESLDHTGRRWNFNEFTIELRKQA